MKDRKHGTIARKRSGGYTLLELTITLAVIVVISSGIFLALRQPRRSALDNAIYQLQADIRYAQRRALIGGQEYRVEIFRLDNMYRILYPSGEVLRRVDFQDGVNINFLDSSTRSINHVNLIFYPRGTSSTGVTVQLRYRRQYYRYLTVTVSGGRVTIRDTRPDRRHIEDI